MDKKYKRDLGGFLFLNKFKRTFKENIGEIISNSSINNSVRTVERRVHTDDKQFIEFLNNPVIIDPSENIIRKPKKYDVYNKTNGNKIAEIDRNLDVYNEDNLYVGTFKSANKLLLIILIILLSLITLFSLSIHLIDVSSEGRRPILIEVSDADGTVLTTEWDVFSDVDGDSTIYPGKSGDYLFKVSNLNKFDVVLSFEFTEDNELDIPMVYTISDNNGYIIGGKDKYVSIEHLGFGNVVIKKGEAIYLELEWLWQTISDQHDTSIGISGDTKYTINISIVAKEKGKK